MAFSEFWAAECTRVELLTLCKKMHEEISTERYDATALVPGVFALDFIDAYDSSKIEALAGNPAGFAGVAEQAVKKSGVNMADKRLSPYITSLRDMGYTCFNCFMYAQLTKENRFEEAGAYLKEATAKKEELADFFNGYELFRQGKKKQAKAIMKKIASNKEHPFRKRASAMLGIYEPVSFGLKALWVGVTLVVMLMSTVLESWLGLGTCLVLSGGGMLALALFAAWWDKKWRYGKQKKLCTFNGIMAKYDETIPGTVIDIPKYPQAVGYGDYNDVNFDSSKAQTGQYHKDVSNVSEAIIENTRNIIKDVHDLRILRKEYYMNKCLEGDKAAKTALAVLFDTEYKDGSFTVNKQANPCRFISDKLSMIID